MGAVALGSAVLAAGATAAWAHADREHPGLERIAAAGYAPGVIGAAAMATAGPIAIAAGLTHLGLTKFGGAVTATARGAATTALLGRAAGIAKGIAGVGVAAFAGMAVGTFAARTLGATPPPSVLRDDQLPAPNMERARMEADATYRRLDRSSPNLVVWVAGTMRTFTPDDFARGVHDAFDGDVSLVNTPARDDYQIPQGVADTSAALRLLLTRLEAERAPGQRILLAGESQGAWAMSVALADPTLAKIVDRSVVWGNPGVGGHEHPGASDPKWLDFTDDLDVVGRGFVGDAGMVLDGITNTFDGHVSQAWRVPATAINNPAEGALLAATGGLLFAPDGYGLQTHNYREYMGAAARFLADAPAHDAA